MHGEKLFNIRDSFCRFDRFYIWDEYYKNLFNEMNHYENQFIIDIPEINIAKYNKNNKLIKYYLQNESLDELKSIYYLLKKLELKGYDIAIRVHPRYSNIANVNRIFIDIDIEEKIYIIDSIMECRYVISKFSTVLFQAYLLNKEIIIDDITNEDLYKSLKEYEYIIFDKKHHILSEFILNKR